MKWTSLLSMARFKHDGEPALEIEDPNRTQYQRDLDRILLTSSFRRLRDKTQVFALPENDHVHSRLTHSLVVSSIGRSLGRAIGKYVLKRFKKEFAKEQHQKTIDPNDFGEIVAAACLAHDIGNPPFGHSGEDAIAQFFKQRFGTDTDLSASLTPIEKYDLEYFEGNAQGFRILTKTENHATGGLQLTAATLAAFSKYPREAGEVGKSIPDMGVGSKKHGFMQSERSIFESVALAVGLEKGAPDNDCVAYCRHPLSYLVEAADDITYRILDVEDGLHLGFVPHKEVFDCLEKIASRRSGYHKPSRQLDSENLSYLRGFAISRLRDEACTVFKDNHDGILSGKYKYSIFDEIESRNEIKQLKKIMEEHCYNHHSVIEIELAGYDVLGGLLARMVDAVTATGNTKRLQQIMHLIKFNERPAGSPYKKLLLVTDYVSGMTDRFAVNLYRKLMGVSLPSGSR